MGEMSYASPSIRGSSTFPYNRPSLVEEITTAPFANANVRGIEEDLALIRQGERAQVAQASDEGIIFHLLNNFVILQFFLYIPSDTEDASETDQQKKEDEYTEIREQ